MYVFLLDQTFLQSAVHLISSIYYLTIEPTNLVEEEGNTPRQRHRRFKITSVDNIKITTNEVEDDDGDSQF